MNQKIEKLLPSKKFTKVFGGITLGILAILLIGSIANKNTIYKQNANSKGEVLVVSDLIETDTDQDGLNDWEEALWGTDPNNPDTDGNGVSDGEQIKKIKNTISDTENTDTETIQKPNKTEAMTQEVLTLVSALQQSGQLTPENSQAVSDQIALYLAKGTHEKNFYSINTLQIIQNPTKNQILTYKKNIESSVPKINLKQTDFALIEEYELYIEKKNFEKYTIIGEKFIAESKRLSTIKIPEEYEIKHFNLINGVYRVGEYFLNLAEYTDDPVKSISSLNETESIIDTHIDNFTSISNILK